MLKKINKNKFYAYFFVIASLLAFLFLFGIYLIFYLNNYYNRLIAADEKSYSKQVRQIDADTSDPFITKVPNLKDMIKEPILRKEDPVLGFAEAPLTVFIYSDYDCEYCAEQLEMIKASVEKHENKIKLIWKDYPESDFTSVSYRAAVAARCADEQGLFWEYNERLFSETANLSQTTFRKIAIKTGLDIKRWQTCIDKGLVEKLINDNIFEADALLINGVPFVYVNNQGYLGGIEAVELERLIERTQVSSTSNSLVENNKETEIIPITKYGNYHKSNMYIYYLGTKKENRIESVDLSTFTVIHSARYSIAKDKNYVFWGDKIIENADPENIEYLECSFSKDKNNIYSANKILGNIDVGTFKIINCGDERDLYYLDKSAVYNLISFNKDGTWEKNKIIQGADPDTFEYFPERHSLTDGSGCSYAKDKNNVYFGSEKLINADPAVFTLLIDKGIYGKDKNNVYHESKLIEEADLSSFEPIDYYYSKDKHYVYKNGEIIEGADPNNFVPN
ncbi:DKNYY domain-containing protein [Candidatus Parcubacteria bacterium]|nr:DKNYY domain-containing protein [Candidatus Parcubacteria bacterium]